MRFHIVHPLTAPLAVVEEALLSPGFPARLVAESEHLADGRLESITHAGDTTTRVAWFRGAPHYSSGRFAKMGALAWTETVAYDRRAHAGTVSVVPYTAPAIARRVDCSGTYTLEPEGPTATRRTISGELVCRIPLVGAIVEGRVAELLAAVFADEARLLGRGSA